MSPDYKELIIDQYLLRLETPSIEPGFRDERNCLVIWARPPNHVIELAAKIQTLLQQASPSTSSVLYSITIKQDSHLQVVPRNLAHAHP